MDLTNIGTGFIVFAVAISIAIIFAVTIVLSILISKGKEITQKIKDSAKAQARELLNEEALQARIKDEFETNEKLKKSLRGLSKAIDKDDLSKKLEIDDSLGIEVENVEGVDKYHKELDSDVRYDLRLEEVKQTPKMLKKIASSSEGWEGDILRKISERDGKNFVMKTKEGALTTQDREQGFVSKNEYMQAFNGIYTQEQIETYNDVGEVTRIQNIGLATIFITARKADELTPAMMIFGWIPKNVYIETATGEVVATEQIDESFAQFNTGFNEYEVDLEEYTVDFSKIDEEIDSLQSK